MWLTQYQKRATLMGNSDKEVIINHAIDDWGYYLEHSPNIETIELNGIEMQGGILTSRNTDSKAVKKLLVELGTELRTGWYVKWDKKTQGISIYEPDDPRNWWIIVRIRQVAAEGHQRCDIVQCNNLLKWVDEYGVENHYYAYAVGTLDAVIRDNFMNRAQNVTVSLPNTNIKVIMPRTDVFSRENRIILGGEAWRVVDYDRVSIDNLQYVSLVESDKNLESDLLLNEGDLQDLADVTKLGKARIKLNPDTEIGIGDSFTIVPSLAIDGVDKNSKFIYAIDGEWVKTGNNLYESSSFVFASSIAGPHIITVALKQQPLLTSRIVINVDPAPMPSMIYTLEGSDSIRWGRTSTYTTYSNFGSVKLPVNAIFTINNSLVKIESGSDSCTLTANMDNEVGFVTLTANISGNIVTKNIEIRSLW